MNKDITPTKAFGKLKVAALCIALVVTGCGTGTSVTATPNATVMLNQAATGIAAVATTQVTPTLGEQPQGGALAAGTTRALLATTMTPTADLVQPQNGALASVTPGLAASVPVSGGQSQASTPTAVPTPSPSPTPVPTLTPTPTAVPMPTASPTASAIVEYTVVAGDTLLSIALKYHVSLATLVVQNDINNAALINEGQVLQIPNISGSANAENVFWTVYIVQSGDNLSQIALQNDVSVDDLVTANKIVDPAALSVGQRLILPLSNPADMAQKVRTPNKVQAAVAPEPASRSASAAAAAPPPAPIQAVNVGGADAMRASLLAAYNQARAAYGVAPLTMASVLQQAAQLHAQDCVQRGYGSHVGSDGATAHQRIARAGFAGYITGENWAWGDGPADAFDMWYNQESDVGPHRANILSARYTEVGFGIAASPGGYYFIADFGAP